MRSQSKDEWQQAHARYWDEQANAYDSLYTGKWCSLEDADTRNRLSLIAPPVGLILDLACGTGLGFRLCQEFGFIGSYLGLDISEEMLERMREAGIEGVRGSMEGLDKFSSDSFDLVLALNTSLSFAYDPNKVVKESVRLLKPGGALFVSALSRWSLRRLLRAKFMRTEAYRTRGTRSRENSVPAHCLSVSDLKCVARESMLENVSVTGQSVFGGVLEAPMLWKLDCSVAVLAPGLCHQLMMSGRKPVLDRTPLDEKT